MDRMDTQLDSRSGALLWQRENLPCESAPVVVGRMLIVATTRGEAIGLRPRTGKEVYRKKLPGPVRKDLRSAGRRVVLATTNAA